MVEEAINNNNLTVVIPVFNEGENLPLIIENIISFCQDNSYDLIFVNDGSSDNSREIIEPYCKGSVRIINHQLNKGYGAAIKSGFKATKTKYVVTADADGQHNFKDIDNLFKKIIETDADLIVGKRGNSVDTLFRYFGKWLILTVAKLLMPLSLTDINSGMKIYKTNLAVKYMTICPNNFSFNILPLIFINQKNLVLEEIIYIEKRQYGESKVKNTAGFDIIFEIIYVISLFNPMRLFLPISIFLFIFGVFWSLRFLLNNEGFSTGSVLILITSLLVFILGVLAEQISQIRKEINKID